MFLLYKHTDDDVFDDFPKISDHSLKISKDFPAKNNHSGPRRDQAVEWLRLEKQSLKPKDILVYAKDYHFSADCRILNSFGTHVRSTGLSHSKCSILNVRIRPIQGMSVVSPTSQFADTTKSFRLHRSCFAYTTKSFRLHQGRFAYTTKSICLHQSRFAYTTKSIRLHRGRFAYTTKSFHLHKDCQRLISQLIVEF